MGAIVKITKDGVVAPGFLVLNYWIWYEAIKAFINGMARADLTGVVLGFLGIGVSIFMLLWFVADKPILEIVKEDGG